MGLLDVFKKKKEQEFDNPPFLPDSKLPPLPPLPKEEPPKPLPPKPIFPEKEQPPEKLPPLPPLPKDIEPTLPDLKMKPIKTAAPKKPKAEVFVRLGQYKDIVSTVNSMENKFNELQAVLNQIKSLRTKEGEIIENWANLIKEAKNKIAEINSKLPEPE